MREGYFNEFNAEFVSLIGRYFLLTEFRHQYFQVIEFLIKLAADLQYSFLLNLSRVNLEGGMLLGIMLFSGRPAEIFNP